MTNKINVAFFIFLCAYSIYLMIKNYKHVYEYLKIKYSIKQFSKIREALHEKHKTRTDILHRFKT